MAMFFFTVWPTRSGRLFTNMLFIRLALILTFKLLIISLYYKCTNLSHDDLINGFIFMHG